MITACFKTLFILGIDTISHNPSCSSQEDHLLFLRRFPIQSEQKQSCIIRVFVTASNLAFEKFIFIVLVLAFLTLEYFSRMYIVLWLLYRCKSLLLFSAVVCLCTLDLQFFVR